MFAEWVLWIGFIFGLVLLIWFAKIGNIKFREWLKDQKEAEKKIRKATAKSKKGKYAKEIENRILRWDDKKNKGGLSNLFGDAFFSRKDVIISLFSFGVVLIIGFNVFQEIVDGVNQRMNVTQQPVAKNASIFSVLYDVGTGDWLPIIFVTVTIAMVISLMGITRYMW